MDSSQNPSSDRNQSRTNDREPDPAKKPSQPRESYYYDDSTGYDIYEDEVETEERSHHGENGSG